MKFKRYLIFIIAICFVLSGCSQKNENSSSSQSSSIQNQSDIQGSTPYKVVGDESKQSSVTQSVPENDFETYTENIYDAIKNFDWIGFENKPFFKSQNGGNTNCDIYITDINNDSVTDIILSSIDEKTQLAYNEVFTFDNNKIISIGGFLGSLNQSEGTHNEQDKTGIINLYRNDNGERLFIQWTDSKTDDANLILCEVFVDTMIYNPVAAVYSSQNQNQYYLFDNQYPNSSKEFLVNDFTDIVSSTTETQYNNIISACEQSLSQIGEIPYKFVTSFNIENISQDDVAQTATSPDINQANQKISNMICENIKNF